jgi:hypothetical protein
MHLMAPGVFSVEFGVFLPSTQNPISKGDPGTPPRRRTISAQTSSQTLRLLKLS